jgi:hypothetical protein
MPNEEGEIAAIFARLRDEVRNRPAEGGIRGLGSATYPREEARLRAERTWSVSAERPFQSRPDQGPLRRYLAAPVKRALRKSMRWYVEPLAAEQRSFNLAILTLVDDLAEQVHADMSRLESRIQALEERFAGERADPGEDADPRK